MNHQSSPKFAVIPNSSVTLYAESLGHANLSEEIVSSLSEDVTYRLREVIHNALRFTRHSKRRHLTTDDVNLALTWSNSQVIYGQNGVDVPNFRTFNFKDSTLSYMEDRDANLRETAFDQTLPADPGEVSIKAQWLVFEGQNCSGGKQNKDEIGSKEVLEEPFATFLERTISSVFGRNAAARKVALDTLRTNGKLQSILPYLVTFLASQVKSCGGKDSLKSIVKGVLFIVHALTENTSLFLLPYVLQLVKLLLFVITDSNLPASFWRCKLNAARILTQLCRRHMSTMNYLPHHLLKAYQETLSDESKALGSIYGAAFGVSCLGAELSHQLVYPSLLKRIPSIIETVNVSKDLNIIHGSFALLELFQVISLFLLRTATSSTTNPSMKSNRSYGGAGSVATTSPLHKYFSIYNEVSDIFGEAIAFHSQFRISTANNIRSVFIPYRTAASKVGCTKSQDNGVRAKNWPLKKEPPSDDANEMDLDFMKDDGAVSEPAAKMFPNLSLQTTVGTINTTMKWRKRKIDQTIFEEDNALGIKMSRKTRLEDDVHRTTRGGEKYQICKLSQRFSKAQRIRLMDLARIPSTVYIVI